LLAGEGHHHNGGSGVQESIGEAVPVRGDFNLVLLKLNPCVFVHNGGADSLEGSFQLVSTCEAMAKRYTIEVLQRERTSYVGKKRGTDFAAGACASKQSSAAAVTGGQSAAESLAK
jgi:hypothetical protein